MPANTLTDELTSLLAERLRAHGVVHAAVFGSLARERPTMTATSISSSSSLRAGACSRR